MSFNYIRLRSGKKFNFLKPTPRQINIMDIAWALSGIPRFTAHSSYFYSVAQHSCLCSDRVEDDDLKFEALMHDAAEAYMGDCSSPLKQLLPDFKIIEHRIEGVISRKYKLQFPLPKEVKTVDIKMLATEMRDLMIGEDYKRVNEKPFDDRIKPWTAEWAYVNFLARYDRLKRN